MILLMLITLHVVDPHLTEIAVMVTRGVASLTRGDWRVVCSLTCYAFSPCSNRNPYINTVTVNKLVIAPVIPAIPVCLL